MSAQGHEKGVETGDNERGSDHVVGLNVVDDLERQKELVGHVAGEVHFLLAAEEGAVKVRYARTDDRNGKRPYHEIDAFERLSSFRFKRSVVFVHRSKPRSVHQQLLDLTPELHENENLEQRLQVFVISINEILEQCLMGNLQDC